MTDLSDRLWQFWIDVGGTFTDCVARRPDGQLVRCKLLSSGVVKGSLAACESLQRIQVAAISQAAIGGKDDFFRGYQLRWIDERGEVIHESRIVHSRKSSSSVVSGEPATGLTRVAVPSKSVSITESPSLPLADDVPTELPSSASNGSPSSSVGVAPAISAEDSIADDSIADNSAADDSLAESFDDVFTMQTSHAAPAAVDAAGHEVEPDRATFDNLACQPALPRDAETSWGFFDLEEPLPRRFAPGTSLELVSDESAPLLAIRMLLNLRRDEPIPAVSVRLATTRGTNALLTRQGAKTGLITTRGFADLPWIGTQNRPKLFALSIHKPAPLLMASAEIDARVSVTGEVLVEPDREAILTTLRRLQADGVESLAICLLHAYRFAEQEQLVEELAREVGFREISLSSQVAPLIKLVSRSDTTVVDAYLNPVLRAYVAELRKALDARSSLRLLTSAGGLVEAAAFRGKDSILSGPAGGVVGFSRVAQACGFERAIGFDMGGTSTDVARFDGRFEYEFETEKAGVRIVSPMMAIETVAAGGGSICWFDGVKLRVGPQSAGAEPGPACYGRGGPLTVTDLNLLLGRLVPSEFPFKLDQAAADQRLRELCQQVNTAYQAGYQMPEQTTEQTTAAKTAGHLVSVAAANAVETPGAFESVDTKQADTSISKLPVQSSHTEQTNAARQSAGSTAVVSPGREPVAERPGVAALYTPERLAEGLLRLANANMATAIRSISIHKGFDPADYLLVAFGGAAPQHACAIAAELGMRRILVHPDASVLSALGTGLADITRHRAVAVGKPYSKATVEELAEVFDTMIQSASDELRKEGVQEERIEVLRALDLRYRGVDAYLTIHQPDDGDYAREFQQQHQRLYGYTHAQRPLEILAARVELIGRSELGLHASRPVTTHAPGLSRVPSNPSSPSGIRAARTQKAWIDGAYREAGLFTRDEVPGGTRVLGPALIVEPLTTTVIDTGWFAERLSGGELLLQPIEQNIEQNIGPSCSPRFNTGSTLASVEPELADRVEVDPVLLEIFNNHFAGIATQMGITLRNTSSSVNVKERLDFSCALFTADGDLVVNAPHIPVHLGAMSETVKRALAEGPPLVPGDVLVTNDPYRGGSHLPDVTVITPVHDPLTGELRFLTASRAHHAELGGMTPGSMPPFSTQLSQEGVLLRRFLLVAAGEPRFDELRKQLLSGPYPTRAVEDNLADMAAQIAANRQGADDLQQLVQRYSWPVVQNYMMHMLRAAEQKLRAVLRALPDGRREWVDHLDDGSPIRVAITIQDDTANIDFTGTGPVLAGNLNANRAIVTAAIIYTLRLLIDEEIPINQGLLRPITIELPTCLLNPPGDDDPSRCPAVVGGNVETSQRVVDVLLGALGLAAASQGTRNNLLFGDATFGYYETICGGSGATATAAGADAVHTHMTNTRLTDPEVLEQRYPVRLHSFSIRRGSGGAGKHRGGDGVEREIEFLREVTVSILSQRRGPYPPYGFAGGEPGQCGENLWLHATGQLEQLPALSQFQAAPGDRLILRTPGAGAWGKGP